ncbi:hypothetical protein DFH27DRAFT_573799 [Peziza echinospora]|nr:hypothetical protein DFH27DRAFT_573799 [Peziza echinospora]
MVDRMLELLDYTPAANDDSDAHADYEALQLDKRPTATQLHTTTFLRNALGLLDEEWHAVLSAARAKAARNRSKARTYANNEAGLCARTRALLAELWKMAAAGDGGARGFLRRLVWARGAGRMLSVAVSVRIMRGAMVAAEETVRRQLQRERGKMAA